jgi:hypothetical protein
VTRVTAEELAAIEPTWPENEYNVYAPPGFCGDIHCTCAQDAVTFMTREQFMLAFTARPEDLNGDNNGVAAAMTED